MQIGAVTITLQAPWVHSLKEKRSELKSLIQKLRNKFNISVAETDKQDIHQTMVISIAFIAPHAALVDSMLSQITSYIEANIDAEIIEIQEIQ